MQVGDTLDGRFRLEQRVGAGGMGVVFRGTDGDANHPVAVKVVRGDTHALDRFTREAAFLASLEHPRIVRYVAHGCVAGGHYLAMEWLDGEDLARRLARGSLALPEVLVVVRGVAEALAVLHARGIVHRDIKPANVFLVDSAIDRLKLLDLGIARALDLAWNLTATGAAIGTPAYMAPEQARGEPVDARADVFSLGCLLFECLTGRSPFQAAHPIAVLARILVDEPPRLGDLGLAVPDAVEALLAAMLAKDPELRPRDGAAVLAALAAISQTQSAVPPPPSALTAAERRVVSIVLTRSASETDATMHATDSRGVDERVRAAVGRQGAHVERLANGSYLALFTGAGVPSDNAADAAAFAIDLATILVGDAVVLATGRAELHGRTPIGEVIERAVTVLGHAHPGVELDDTSAVLVADRFEVVRVDTRQRLIRSRDALEPRRTLLGQVIPCIGRERELALLRTTLSTCVSEPVASAVLVSAPPGTGKSRLVAEAVHEARAGAAFHTLLLTGCEAMHAGSPYGLAGRTLRRAFHGDDDPWRTLLTRLDRRRSAEDRERITALLLEVAGVVGDETSPHVRELRSDPTLFGDAISDAWIAWLTAECELGPVLLVLENLHWGDRASVALIDAALRTLADQPLCVLATARPEVHDLFPRLWGDHSVQEIRLGNLSRRHAERLARQSIGTTVADAVVQRLVDRAGGHPFMLEELIRAAAGSTTIDDLPDTVLGMIEARFVHLRDDARAALRAASVFGESFWPAAVQTLRGGVPVEATLERLAAAEFVERRPASRFPGHPEYAFRHVLVRDAAYAMLTAADQLTGHRLAGEWLCTTGERDALLLAEHFARGGAPAQALRWYQRAAEDALAGDDLLGAIRLARRALGCSPDDTTRGELELTLAEATAWSGDHLASRDHALTALGLFALGSDRWFRAATLTIGSIDMQGHPELQALIARLVAAATIPTTDAQLIALSLAVIHFGFVSRTALAPLLARLDSLLETAQPGPLAQGWIARARADSLPDRWRRAASWADATLRAAEAFERGGAPRYGSQCRIFRAVHLSAAGQFDEALAILEHALGTFEHGRVQRLRVFARYGSCVALFFAGRDDACRSLLATVFAHGPSVSDFHYDTTLIAGIIAFDADDFAGAAARARSICDHPLCPAAYTCSAHGLLARTLVRLGELDAALAAGEEAVARDTGEYLDKFIELATIGLAEARLARGDEPGARTAVATAWARAFDIPMTDQQRREYTERRVVRDLAALARRLGIA